MSAHSSTRRFGLPRRFDTLRVKLFVAIAGANALLALLAFVVFSWSFDQGFVEYLNRADETRLQPLVTRLGSAYKDADGWTWVTTDRRRWPEMIRDVLGFTRGSRRFEDGPPPTDSSPQAEPGGLPPPPPLPPEQFLTIDPRLLLFDADRHMLVGRPEMIPEVVFKPIDVDGRTVGYLGYVPRLKMVTSLEQLFSSQQTAKFAAIAIGMLIAGLAIAALLATWLTARIRRLAQGAEALIQGNYAMRIGSEGHDELARLADDFNQLAETLEAAQRARQQWIADIAHELRTPLAVLRAEIEALQDGVRPMSEASMGSLAQEVARLTRLVEDLRLLSLSDLGALTYQRERLDLGELVEEVVEAHSLATSRKRLRVDADVANIEVVADASRLAQVFGNLMQNTLRYTDDGGTLHVGVSTEFDVGGHSQAVVVWEDSSPGVPEQDLSRLTERLFRVDESRSSTGGGSGLGLAIARAIVEGLGGAMTPSSSPLGGLRWTIAFPRQA